LMIPCASVWTKINRIALTGFRDIYYQISEEFTMSVGAKASCGTGSLSTQYLKHKEIMCRANY